MSAQFSFAKLVVKDLDAQAAFYGAVLGLAEVHRFSGGEGDGAFDEVVLGGQPSLLLMHFPRRTFPRPGEVVLGFAVDDVDRAVRAAEAAGGVVRTAPKSIPQPAMRVATVEDTEGHLLELVQHL
ncbi:VOC family protein [Amycolatopsis lurida]